MTLRISLGALALVALGASANGQSSAPDNWFNLDAQTDGVTGVGTERVYKELLAGKTGAPVVVAIIDSGVDAEHEDLVDVMWVNPGEVADNGIDDDGNGYIDDVHGWNFIGGADGQNVGPDTYEITRVYAAMRARYGGSDTLNLNKRERRDFKRYKDARDIVEQKRTMMLSRAEQYDGMLKGLAVLEEKIGDDFTLEQAQAYQTNDPFEQMILGVATDNLSDEMNAGDLYSEIENAYEYFNNSASFGWNPDFETRSIVGDNYADVNERIYGNNDVEGPDAFHGTHVAGIVAAKRGNDVGMNGVADNARIMSIRTVPDGDERDKDVANAIRYAVDNGAQVVNMSFGKGASWDKEAVDKAVKYAAKNDVLLVHAAGNEGENLAVASNFPNDTYERKGFLKFLKKKYPNNWIEVGALSWKSGEDAVATFSNYGQRKVDIFSPGVDIYSTAPNNEYKNASGTSMASPVTAGVAAMLRSYFPELKAKEVKEIMLESGKRHKGMQVILPGSDVLVPFEMLSATGATLDAAAAVRLAQKRTGKPGGVTPKA